MNCLKCSLIRFHFATTILQRPLKCPKLIIYQQNANMNVKKMMTELFFNCILHFENNICGQNRHFICGFSMIDKFFHEFV